MKYLAAAVAVLLFTGTAYADQSIPDKYPESVLYDPAAKVLHYGQEIFEGMKAYRNPRDGSVHMFRPDKNIKRFNISCERMSMPQVDPDLFMDALNKLIDLDRDWVPESPNALYIRPTIIAMDPFLGVRASFTYRFFIILSPVGAYYAEGFNPVKIMVTKDHVRAVRGGVGDTKTLGNYAASLLAGDARAGVGYYDRAIALFRWFAGLPENALPVWRD